MVAVHDEKKEEHALQDHSVELLSRLASTQEFNAITLGSMEISSGRNAAKGIQKQPVSVAGVGDAGGSVADKTANPTPIDAEANANSSEGEPKTKKLTPAVAEVVNKYINPDAEANANRSFGTRIINFLGKISSLGLGAGGAAATGTYIAAAAGDSKANELVSSAFGAGTDGISAGKDALNVGSWANSDAWNGNQGISKGHNYNKGVGKLGLGAYIGGALSAGSGLISTIAGGVDWFYGKKREKAAQKNGDAAGVTLGTESKWNGIQSIASGVGSMVSGASKISAAATGSAAALGVAGGFGAVGSVVSLYQGGKMFFEEAKRKWKNRKFTPLSDLGKSWNKFVNSKKNKRMALSALKMVGAGLGIAAAVLGTVGGAGIPLLLAGSVIAGGMGVAKFYRSYSNNKKISAAKAKMRADGRYNEEYTSEKNKKKWFDPRRLLNQSNKTVESGEPKIPDENKIKKGSTEELEEIKETQLAQKRAKAGNKNKAGNENKDGNENVESKFSVARGIKDKLKSAGENINKIVEKVDKWLDTKAFEKKDQDKAAAAANAVEKQAAASKKSYFWSNWGKKTTSPALVPAVPKPIAPNTTEQPAAAAQMVPSPSDVAEPAAAEDSATAKPAEGNSTEDKSPSEPSNDDKEVFDAFHVSQKIGVTPEEAISGSGEELIEKRLSVTNSL
ncbi:MAG: hypothetical protein NBV77_01990 [Bacteroidia bacterium]|nr:hypothetical protein [Bacteroidia bacterium]